MTTLARSTHIVRVVKIGGNLTITVPRRLARELGIVQHGYFYITRRGPTGLALEKVERPHDSSAH